MSKHKDRMRKAIEFGRPDFTPMDLTDVPFLYDAYDTLKPSTVTIPAGAEEFDSAWCTYHWTLNYLGGNENGELLRKDEWGCTQVIPRMETSAYSVVGRPKLDSLKDVAGHPWPSPQITDRFFGDRKEIIDRYYPDRFINGFLDPGPFLVAFELLGYENLLFKMFDDPDLVREVLARIFQYQKELVPRFREMGADMITIIDEVAGSGGMMFSPDLFRERYLPMYADLFAEIHRNNMYVSVLFDGDIGKILDGLMKLDIDLQFFAQPNATGIDVLAERFRGKRAVKMTADMMGTLAKGTPEEIEGEIDAIAERFWTDKGGLVFQALRWHRPAYRRENVDAQIRAMNKYR